jgi:hypothetical protein
MSTSTGQGNTAETGSNKSKDSRGTSGNKSFKTANASYRSETGIKELKGYIFTYGTQGQQSNYIRTKKALADHVGTTKNCTRQSMEKRR